MKTMAALSCFLLVVLGPSNGHLVVAAGDDAKAQDYYDVVVRLAGLVGFYSEPRKLGDPIVNEGEVGHTWAFFPQAGSQESQTSFLMNNVQKPDVFSHDGKSMPPHHLVIRLPLKNLVGSSMPGSILLDPTAEDPYAPDPYKLRRTADIGLSATGAEGAAVTLEKFQWVPRVLAVGQSGTADAALDKRLLRDDLLVNDDLYELRSRLAGRMKFGPGWTLTGCGTGDPIQKNCAPAQREGKGIRVRRAWIDVGANCPEKEPGKRVVCKEGDPQDFAGDVVAHIRLASDVKLKLVIRRAGSAKPTEITLMPLERRIEVFVGSMPAVDIIHGLLEGEHSVPFEHGKLLYMLTVQGKLKPPYPFWHEKTPTAPGRYCTGSGRYAIVK